MREETLVRNIVKYKKVLESMIVALTGDFSSAEDLFQETALIMTRKRAEAEEDARRFNERIRAEPRARRRLAEAAFDMVQLRDALAAGEAAPAPLPGARRPSWIGPRSSLVAAALMLLALGFALVFRTPSPASVPSETTAAAGRRQDVARPEGAGKARRPDPEVGQVAGRPSRPEKTPEASKEARFQGFHGTVQGVVEGKGTGVLRRAGNAETGKIARGKRRIRNRIRRGDYWSIPAVPRP